jgi:hypothetical protein
MRVNLTPLDTLLMFDHANDKGWPHVLVHLPEQSGAKTVAVLAWEVDASTKPMELEIVLRADGTWSASANLILDVEET